MIPGTIEIRKFGKLILSQHVETKEDLMRVIAHCNKRRHRTGIRSHFLSYGKYATFIPDPVNVDKPVVFGKIMRAELAISAIYENA